MEFPGTPYIPAPISSPGTTLPAPTAFSLMPRVVKILGLKKIPHFTTLQEFFKRISSFLLEKVLTQTVKLFDIDDARIAIDGTGHSSSYASLYYAKKLKKQKRGEERTIQSCSSSSSKGTKA